MQKLPAACSMLQLLQLQIGIDRQALTCTIDGR